MTPEDVARLREKATPGRWAYKPLKHDDWGYVRAYEEGTGRIYFVCQAQDQRVTERQQDAARVDGIDPWEGTARFIAAAHDMADLIASQARVIAEVTAERDKWSFYAHLYSAWVNEMAETLEDRKNDLDPDDWEDQKILGLLEKAEAGIVAAYRARWQK